MSIQVKDLHVRYGHKASSVHAVRGVSFDVPTGAVFGLVGESGSGKSSIAKTGLRLLDTSQVEVAGAVRFGGHDIVGLGNRDGRRVLRTVGYIPQNPFGALNPVLPVYTQMWHRLGGRRAMSRDEAIERCVGHLDEVGVEGQSIARSYPHQLSGGMAQRVVIAMALSADSAYLVADEPTTALDLTVQRQILDLLAGVVSDRNLTTVLITHDLGVVAHIATHVGVMKEGELVELGRTREVFSHPSHPYTAALLEASYGGRAPTPASAPTS